jgi:hypothetical protein
LYDEGIREKCDEGCCKGESQMGTERRQEGNKNFYLLEEEGK